MTVIPYEIAYVAYDGTVVTYEETYRDMFKAVKSAIELQMAGHKIIRIRPAK